jgi:hypothetical protein
VIIVEKPKSIRTGSEVGEIVVEDQSGTGAVALCTSEDVAAIYYALVSQRDKLVSHLASRYDGSQNYTAEDDRFLAGELLRVVELMVCLEESEQGSYLVKAVGATRPEQL